MISLHYINKIDFAGSEIEVAKYLNFYPGMREEFPTSISGFIVGIGASVPTVKGETKVQLTNARALGGRTSVILDLDHRWTEKDGIQIEDVEAWLDAAHKHLVHLFESCITDRTRELFGKPNE